MPLTALTIALAAQSISQPVPRAEYLATMDAQFSAMDSDGNGWVTSGEAARKMTVDTQAQVMAANRQIFQRLDKDRNGQLSAEEFAGLAASPPPADPSNFMQRVDLNKDGQVTLVEHRTVMLATFDRIDADKDGVVTPEEMQGATGGAAGQ
ncbi:EF-hand domain-containing protein [Sphingomicrobium lutaoense]|uniref:Ca2+-binding EF-hand superfamily protein n=1 Tax=Sphingomicrobium lutaoense TaxID=515949 RepID=A0A839Z022_9SPHN|nr:EF-hand domain-containing protein [Sphingomicrobium lutaoense]MBB3764709.1 Ca2+-binding EF-hand superfamily protein [Sphingomicrobium lutaoense]